MAVGVVGLGYVGLPLVLAFAEAGERVVAHEALLLTLWLHAASGREVGTPLRGAASET